ncbi:hypothetical protein [Haliangium sp.]|uniref:hypothetical protein n=1 Tax=Haliangium sp. TaxID=2663208 RepID=UPI003D14E695
MAGISAAAVACVVAAWAPSPVAAGNLWGVGAEPTGADQDPVPAEAAAEVAYRRELDKGDEYAVLALEARSMRRPPGLRARSPSTVHMTRLALAAVEAYENAAALRPQAAEPHLRAAQVLHEYFLSPRGVGVGYPLIRDRARAEQALAHWQSFEDRAPLDPRVVDTLFERGLVHTRLAGQRDLENAIACYETLLERIDPSQVLSINYGIYLGNLAETYMMVGRVEDAIATYERALDHGNRATHGYGLAVALDRDGQTTRAREVMLTYAMADQLRDLADGGTFFVPEGEKDYYLALGYESLGEMALAARHYRRFIASGAHPRFQPRARDNLRRVEAEVSRAPVRRRGSAGGGGEGSP